MDFYCAELRLAVEVDGTIHGGRTQAEYDEARSRALATAGISVVRISNEQVSEAGLVALLAPYASPLSTKWRGGSGGEATKWRGGQGVRVYP